MVNDIPDMRDSSTFLDELEEEDNGAQLKPKRKRRAPPAPKGFMGLTPIQTFIISAMLFFIVCFIGFFFMLVTGKMVFTL